MKHLLRSRIYPNLPRCARSHVLDVVHGYACGVLGRAPCISGHLRLLATVLMNSPG